MGQGSSTTTRREKKHRNFRQLNFILAPLARDLKIPKIEMLLNFSRKTFGYLNFFSAFSPPVELPSGWKCLVKSLVTVLSPDLYYYYSLVSAITTITLESFQGTTTTTTTTTTPW